MEAISITLNKSAIKQPENEPLQLLQFYFAIHNQFVVIGVNSYCHYCRNLLIFLFRPSVLRARITKSANLFLNVVNQLLLFKVHFKVL